MTTSIHGLVPDGPDLFPGFVRWRDVNDPPRWPEAADTIEQRRQLCGAPVTLDGQPAQISGARNDFATVSDRTGRAFEWAWPTVARIVANGGAFKS